MRARTKPPRAGRPSSSQALVLEEHLLNVAEELFMSAGFEAVSIDQLAVAARASKNTIYRRYVSKEALFIAVTERAIKRLLRDSNINISGATIAERLEQLALNIVHQELRPQLVALVRVVIPEVRRFAELARTLDVTGRLAVIAFISSFLRAEVASGHLHLADAPDVCSAQFLHLTGGSLFMRALLGADIDQLKKEAPAIVKSGVAHFLRSCPKSPRPGRK